MESKERTSIRQIGQKTDSVLYDGTPKLDFMQRAQLSKQAIIVVLDQIIQDADSLDYVKNMRKEIETMP